MEQIMDKVVVITGALAGIGQATARAFAEEGARLVLSGRNETAGQALVAELKASGAEAEFVAADVRKDEEVGALLDRAVARFGRVDVLVNNAGTEGKPGPLAEQTAESLAATFDTNVAGTLFGLKHAFRIMGEQGGAVVNISSTYGHRGGAGAAIYAASKHAVEGLTKSAALEGAPKGIRVNAVAPGPVATAMLDRFAGGQQQAQQMAAGVPIGRLGRPEDIADAIVFLASDRAGFITGQVLGVDGGKNA
jgi:NAD(P)-dependent dehydrogenase (short-subunit alcohol dehydrogenase family)